MGILEFYEVAESVTLLGEHDCIGLFEPAFAPKLRQGFDPVPSLDTFITIQSAVNVRQKAANLSMK